MQKKFLIEISNYNETHSFMHLAGNDIRAILMTKYGLLQLFSTSFTFEFVSISKLHGLHVFA